MSTLPDFSRQYQPPKIPTHWSADERRFAQGVTDVLDDIYLRYGRLSKKDLSPALSKEILDASGNIVQLQLDTSGLTTRMLSAEGSLSTLEQTATSFDTRISNAEGGISTLTQTAAGIETRVGNAEGDISTLEQTANSLTSRISGVEGVNSTQQTEINQNKLDITLKASETTVTALAGRVTTAEGSISTQAGQIALKAEKTVTDGLNARMTSAEQKITATAIVSTVRSSTEYTSDLAGKQPTGDYATNSGVDSKLTNYSTIAQTDSSITLAVNNVQVGGTNLIKDSQLVNQYPNDTGFGTITVSGSGNEAFHIVTPNVDKPVSTYGNDHNYNSACFETPLTSGTYTVSAEVFVWTAMSVGFYNDKGLQPVPANTWTRIKHTYTYNQYSHRRILGLSGGTSGQAIRCRRWKLEKGTMATDWSPSPSDPASGVKTSKVTIDNNGVAIVTGGVFTVSSGNFGIDASGNVTVKGTVIATSGTIGGITIRSNALSIGKTSASDPSAGMWLDSTGLSLGSLRISESGYFFNNYFTLRAPNNGSNVTLLLETNVLGTGTSYGSMQYSFSDDSASMNIIEGTVSMKVPNVSLHKLFVTYRYFTTDQSTTMYVSSNLYCNYNCSALSFTDRTPAYTGNALDELRWVRGNRAQGIDHNSIPPFARKTIKNTRTLPDGTVEHYHEPGRDLGAMISILTKAVQEIDDRMNAFERRLPA